MLEEEIGADCTFICSNGDIDEKQFGAHRAVLMASSPVFHAMFKNKMYENLTSKIRIEDTSPESVRLMLHYLYCGHLLKEPIHKDITVGLSVLCLADKYAIADLKEHIEYILHKLSLDFLFGYKVALNYVCANFQRLSHSDKFKEFGELHPSLLQEVLSIVTKNHRHTFYTLFSKPHSNFPNTNKKNKNRNNKKDVRSVCFFFVHLFAFVSLFFYFILFALLFSFFYNFVVVSRFCSFMAFLKVCYPFYGGLVETKQKIIGNFHVLFFNNLYKKTFFFCSYLFYNMISKMKEKISIDDINITLFHKSLNNRVD
ncbi:hypothetical protein RFI_21250, partial [Reticulomyxa filosa]